MKEAEFHREPAKGEADEEKGEEGIREELPGGHGSSLKPQKHPLKLARMQLSLYGVNGQSKASSTWAEIQNL